MSLEISKRDLFEEPLIVTCRLVAPYEGQVPGLQDRTDVLVLEFDETRRPPTEPLAEFPVSFCLIERRPGEFEAEHFESKRRPPPLLR